MKKNLFTLAVLALIAAGCAKDDVSDVNIPSSNIIRFELSTTRAGITFVDALETGFKVYGTSGLAPTGWYTGIDGTNNHVYAGGKWGWAGNDVSWPAAASGYPMTFYAWYPATVTANAVSLPFVGDPDLTFTYTVPSLVSNQRDLVAAQVTAAEKPLLGTLPMAFSHILSKVNFGINTAEAYTAYVLSLSVEKVSNTGTYNAVAETWSGNNLSFGASFSYYDDGEKEFPGTVIGAQPFYDLPHSNHLMMMPQDPGGAGNDWDPLSGSAPNTETRVEMLYRLEGETPVGYATADSHPDYDTSDTKNIDNYHGPLYVKVAYPYASEWVQGKGYTYNISLPGATGGYLIAQNYCDEHGDETDLPVEEITVPNSILSVYDVVRLVPDLENDFNETPNTIN